MSIALFITCEACESQTTVQRNDDVEVIGNRIRQIVRAVEITRGCFHVCVDDKLKEFGVV
jgi:hypothetical protein